MKILSLFDGMSCGRIALQRAGVEVSDYYASEINEAAIYVSNKNYPLIKHVGDIKSVKIPKGFFIDLLIGGSPCQGFSYSGKRLNFDDPRSALFFEYLRVLKEVKRYNPGVKFLLENVLMDELSENVITDLLGVVPVKINSLHFSAQNRPRIYWTNIDFDKKLPVCETVFNDIRIDSHSDANSFLTKSYNLELNLTPGVKRLDWMSKNIRSMQNIDKQKTVLACEINNDTPSGRSRQSDRVYHAGAKCPCLTETGAQRTKFDMLSSDVNDWRFINITEAERLQTLPDGYTAGVLLSKRFSMIGNGWTVDVLKHIFNGLK